jgi:DNA-binding transcriptional ArsR family regulator
MSTSTEIDLTALQDSAANACRLMKAMANTDRLLLLCQISQSEKSVGELEELTGIRQPTLSQQLTILRDAGLVSTRRDGKKIYYSISSQSALAVMQVLYQEFCGNV